MLDTSIKNELLPIGFRIHHKWFSYIFAFISIVFMMEDLFTYSKGYSHRTVVLFEEDK